MDQTARWRSSGEKHGCRDDTCSIAHLRFSSIYVFSSAYCTLAPLRTAVQHRPISSLDLRTGFINPETAVSCSSPTGTSPLLKHPSLVSSGDNKTWLFCLVVWIRNTCRRFVLGQILDVCFEKLQFCAVLESLNQQALLSDIESVHNSLTCEFMIVETIKVLLRVRHKYEADKDQITQYQTCEGRQRTVPSADDCCGAYIWSFLLTFVVLISQKRSEMSTNCWTLNSWSA